jgi:hypothetical protein
MDAASPLYSKVDFLKMFILSVMIPVLFLYMNGFLGIILYFSLKLVYYKILSLVFKMEPLAALDEFFLLDNTKNRANIITVVKTDKVPDYPRLRKIIIDIAI